VLGGAAGRFDAVDTAASDPSTIIYTSGTTGPPKGALLPHAVLLGNLPGFECSHDGFPRAGDYFWTPADWAWTGGLWDALMPTLFHGHAILRLPRPLRRRARLHAHAEVPRAQRLPLSHRAQDDDEIGAAAARSFELRLRSLMSGGEPVGPRYSMVPRDLGVTVNEIFGQTEMNYIVGNSHSSGR
jgi:acetyl-CoA synthetase